MDLGELEESYTSESILRSLVFIFLIVLIGCDINLEYFPKLLDRPTDYDWADKLIINFYHYSFGYVFSLYHFLYN